MCVHMYVIYYSYITCCNKCIDLYNSYAPLWGLYNIYIWVCDVCNIYYVYIIYLHFGGIHLWINNRMYRSCVRIGAKISRLWSEADILEQWFSTIVLWVCRDSVSLPLLCGCAVTLWVCRDSVGVPWLCGCAVTLWVCREAHDSVSVPWGQWLCGCVAEVLGVVCPPSNNYLKFFFQISMKTMINNLLFVMKWIFLCDLCNILMIYILSNDQLSP